MNIVIEIFIVILLGVCCGTFTGLAPGIHVNLVSLLLLTVSPFLLQYVSALSICCFIISMAITHSFLDAVPSVFLGAPDESQAMNALPGHRLLLQGKGYEAVKLTIIGSMLCLMVGIAAIPLLIPFSRFLYPLMKDYTGIILIIVMAYMLFKDKNRIMNFVVFALSGVLGLLVLNIPNLSDPLFPMLSGLFGTSMLLISLTEKVNIPKQSFDETIFVDKKSTIKAVIAGTLAGVFAGFLPGLGPAQGAVIASQFVKKIGEYGFMILVGGINTVNFVMSFVTLYTIDKARNGAVIVISKIIPEVTLGMIAVFAIAALIAGCASVFLSLKISRFFATMFSKVSYTKVIAGVIIMITLLVFIFSGFMGLLVLLVSTAIGIIPGLTSTARNHQMGCLILPVILFFVL
jgi:putative membrane protein